MLIMTYIQCCLGRNRKWGVKKLVGILLRLRWDIEYLDNFHIHISNVYGNLFEFHLKISNFGRNFERENSIVDVLWSIWNGINWLPHRTPPQSPLLLQRIQFNDNWRTKSIHKLKVRDGRGGPRCPTLPPSLHAYDIFYNSI